MLNLFKTHKTKSFKSADEAFEAIVEMYDANVGALRESFRLFGQGQLKPIIYKTFPLAEAAKAHALMESSEHIGKIVLMT